MLARDSDVIAATRPEPNSGWPVLDVVALQRRADNERSKLRTMVEYAYYPRCRRQYVLEYFGDQDWASRERTCGSCDNCEAIANGRVTGLTDDETASIKRLLALVGALNGRFGRKRIADLATGADEDPRFEEVPERACLAGWGDRQVMDLLRALEGASLIEASRGEYPTISTTRRGDQVAIGRVDPNDLGIQMPTVSAKRNRRGPRKPTAEGGAAKRPPPPWFIKRRRS